MSFVSELMSENQEQEQHYVNSILTGIVKENWNDKYPGMVKVEFILSDVKKKVCDWVRVAMPYCGKEYGMYLLPEVDTEVVVAFVMGDINSPIVIGSVWNNKDTLPKGVADEKNTKKGMITKGGNQVMISEKEKEDTITVTTKKKLCIELSDKEESIKLTDKEGKNKIQIDSKNGEITLEAEKSITIKAGSETLTLSGSGKSTKISSNQFSAEGKQGIALSTKTTLKAEGNITELKAQSSMKVTASGTVQIKGAITKIN